MRRRVRAFPVYCLAYKYHVMCKSRRQTNSCITSVGSSATDTRREIFTNGTRPVSTCDLNGRVPRAPADRRGWPPDLMSLHHIATSIRGRPLTRRTTQVTGLPSPSNRPPWLSRCRADQRNGQVEPTWRVVKPCSVAISQTSVRMRIERRS